VITTTVKKISELSTAIVVGEGLSELRGSINRYVTIRQYGRTVVGMNSSTEYFILSPQVDHSSRSNCINLSLRAAQHHADHV
jgi:hypothetical protein